MEDGRAEGSSVIEDGRQDAISLMLDIHGTHIHIFKRSKLEGSYIGDLSIIFLDDVVRSGHLFVRTIVMFMLKVFIGIFYLRDYCGNIAKFLSALSS